MNKADRVRYTAPADTMMTSVDSASVVAPTKRREPKTEKEEKDAFHELTYYIDTYNRQSPNDRKMEMIGTILYEKNTPKIQKQAALEALLSRIMTGGVKTGTFLESKGRIHAGYASEGLEESFKLVNLIYQYFGNESWYREVLRSMGEKCLDAPLIDESLKGRHINNAVNESHKLDLVDEINRIEPIEDFDAKREAVVAEIGSYLVGLVDYGYYSERDVSKRQGRHYHDIRRLVDTYDLELPSERDLFERDGKEAIYDAEKHIAAVAVSESITRPTDSKIEGAEKAITKVCSMMREAEKRGHKELALPEGYATAIQAESTLRKKFSEAKTITVRKAYTQKLESLQRLLSEQGASLLNNAGLYVRDIVDLCRYFPNELSKSELRVDLERERDRVLALAKNRHTEMGVEGADIEYLAGRLVELNDVKKLLTREIDKLGNEK